MRKPGAVPFELHGQVNPDAGPFLVTKAKGGVIWVDSTATGSIRSGVCKATPGDIFNWVVDAVEDQGRKLEWGNVHPYSPAGIKAAADHLNFYGVTDIEILVPPIQLPEGIRPEKDPQLEEGLEKILGKQEPRVAPRPDWLNPTDIGLPFCITSWLPDNCAVVVPGERIQVGELTHVSAHYLSAIVCNPSRTIAIARGV